MIGERRAEDVSYLSFSNAFDTVSHNIMEKLAKYRLDKRTVTWIENCMNIQALRVVINGTKSL